MAGFDAGNYKKNRAGIGERHGGKLRKIGKPELRGVYGAAH